MWERLFLSLTPGLTADAAALDRAAAELGFALPASYRAFCRTCGVGLAAERFRIAVPVPFEASDLLSQAGLIAHSVGAAVQMLEDGSEPHRFDVAGDDPSVVERACFFAAGDDGSFLFWDVSGGGEEYDIWLLAPDLVTVLFGGESLFDFFARVIGPAAALVLGPGQEPLPARFEGFSEATLARSAQAAP
ncbi:SMI1/KNR4 family protein [Methylobacterium mesophilicum SR1.6/6]|uniref:SMI1/KNR4 family protein n=1 Tax=Methylobacterium mesophilicum SR1.6/6 TaxID=908290 RepID=A0A6B9FMR3_9HYPH|nr:SMI1/KNR4 family protein [Methylobacterium mesophilicum]QGY03292.1 SMI1/KNR4 family protein [Methylobacterium mesophilicum SR1.6/6]